MTVNTWRHSVLNACKCCKRFHDNKKSRNAYLCLKHKSSIYTSYKCKNLSEIFEEASAVSRQALDEAFAALIAPLSQ